jgi:ribosomal 50S subunit-recycling heat shock protein
VDTEVPDGRGVVEIEAEGSDAVARTEGGAFSMTADGQGVVAVGTSSGWASLNAEGESVRIPAGMISVVPGKGKPKKPAQALRNVLLSVAWPEQDETNQKTYPVSGQVAAGSRVIVGGQEVKVDQQGRFKANVPLRQGKQKVGVAVVDVMGRKKRSDRQVLYDPTAPDVRLTRKPWSR